MVKSIIFVFVMSSIFSCGLPYDRLNDGTGRGSKIPKQDYIFRNLNKISSNHIVSQIDINYYYSRIMYYESNRNYEIVNDKSYIDKNKLKIQFYNNGRIRWGADNPSSKISGHRGIVYSNNEKLFADVFLGRADNIMYIANFKIKVEDDTLYFLGTNRIKRNTCHVFVKSEKITQEYKNYNADW